MTSSQQPDAIEQLREQFPRWQFGSVWITANTGPDRRRFWASRGSAFISAWSAPALVAEISKYKFPDENGGHEGGQRVQN